MVSLDDAVLARLEKGGSRYEILVDPDLVENWKEDDQSVEIGDLLAIEEVWSDARAVRGPQGRPSRRHLELLILLSAQE